MALKWGTQAPLKESLALTVGMKLSLKHLKLCFQACPTYLLPLMQVAVAAASCGLRVK